MMPLENTFFAASPILDIFYDALDRDTLEEVDSLVSSLHPAELAHFIESLPANQREKVWKLENLNESEILPYLGEAVRIELMHTMPPCEVAAVTQDMDTDDAVDVLQDLPEDVLEEVFSAMDAQHCQRLTQVLFYPENTAGGLMNTDTLTVRADVSLDVVLRYIRRRRQLPDKTDRLFVVDRENHYQGTLWLSNLLTCDAETLVSNVMVEDVEPIAPYTSAHEVARLFEQRDLVSAPVVDDRGVLIGRITVDDVVDVIRAEGEHNILCHAGLSEDDDLFAPVKNTAHQRALWLGINLATAFLASWVIGLFEGVLEKVVALAVLMPIVASMGGIAGSQTLTVVIRGMALGKVSGKNTPWLLRRELIVGLFNGCVWAIVVALIAGLWFWDIKLSLTIGCAIVINLFFAALSGTLIPLALRYYGIDPALAGGVILTTVTDVVGFAAFLGLATLLMLKPV